MQRFTGRGRLGEWMYQPPYSHGVKAVERTKRRFGSMGRNGWMGGGKESGGGGGAQADAVRGDFRASGVGVCPGGFASFTHYLL